MTMTTTEDAELLATAAEARDLAQDVAALLPILLEVQWDASPRPELDAKERRITGRYADPTARAALDPARLALRRRLARSESDLEAVVIRLRGVRRAMELALGDVAEAGTS
jgi:hypothetical protein